VVFSILVLVLPPLPDQKEPPTYEVEWLLVMIRFDSREKLKDFSLRMGN
jgi:hypothetical protein